MIKIIVHFIQTNLFLNNILYNLYKEKYCWSPRNFNIKHDLPQLTYVGQMYTERDVLLTGHPEKEKYLFSNNNIYDFNEINNFIKNL